MVYLVRNPLDVAVSYAHHLNWSINRTLRLMDDPATHETHQPEGLFVQLPEPLTTWSSHVSSWTQKTALRLHIARYEDLLADPHVGFGTIIRFAGLDWDGPRLGRAIEHCTFHRLHAQGAEFGFAEKQPDGAVFLPRRGDRVLAHRAGGGAGESGDGSPPRHHSPVWLLARGRSIPARQKTRRMAQPFEVAVIEIRHQPPQFSVVVGDVRAMRRGVEDGERRLRDAAAPADYRE